MITIKERDKKLEELWAEFDDVPFNPETDESEAEYQHFPVGTHKFEIWKWFDERYSKGVAALLYKNSNDDTVTTARIYYLNQLTFSCKREDCVFNSSGHCRYALIYEDAPTLNIGGCKQYKSKYPLKNWIWDEVPFRLNKVMKIPELKLTPQVIDAVSEALYDSCEEIFDYEIIDKIIEETLSQLDIYVGDDNE